MIRKAPEKMLELRLAGGVGGLILFRISLVKTAGSWVSLQFSRAILRTIDLPSCLAERCAEFVFLRGHVCYVELSKLQRIANVRFSSPTFHSLETR